MFDSYRARINIVVGVAQLVERQIVVLNAAGSSPVAHPKNKSIFSVFARIQ